MSDHDIEQRKCIYYLSFYTSGKGYVGQTIDLDRRLEEHQKPQSGCRYLKHAIAFYGFDDCSVHILEEDLSIEEANEFETLYIRELGSLVPDGYNLNEGGNCAPMLQETKDLLSVSAVERWADPVFREKQLFLMRTDEYREKHRINSAKMWEDPEFREKHREKMKQLWEDPDFRQNGSDVMVMKWEDVDYRQKVAIGVARYWEDPDNIEAARKRAKKRWEDPEFRKKTTEGTKLACNTPEMKELRSQNGVAKWSDEEYRAKQMETRSSEAFSEKMKASLNTKEHMERKAKARDEKSTRCREAFVRLEGDRRKVSDELGISMGTVADYMKPYKDDEEIIKLKKAFFKAAHNTPEEREKKRKAALASNATRNVRKNVSNETFM
jgi:group I intron endonuclease